MEKIVWELPENRKGWGGFIDWLIGPGATSAEKWLQFAPSWAFTAIIVYLGIYEFGWTWGQNIVIGYIALDMLGGVLTNATSSAKRWFHREGEGYKQHISFLSMHFIQLTLVNYFFMEFSPIWIITIGIYMLIVCTVVLKSPQYLQRPLSLGLFVGSLMLSLYVFESPQHLEWFLPVFFLKLQISHILKEEPYRPENEN
jgi:hypothetical protein